MTNHGERAGGADIRDRKAGLVIFGILEILLGAFCVLEVLFVILSILISAILNKSHAQPLSTSMMFMAILFYVFLAVWFIWLGIGSIKARRWARALLLVTSWLWLISGIIGLVFVLVFLPDIYDQMGKSGQIPQQTAAVIKYVMIGFMAVFSVVIPGVLVLFYGSRHVKATCERMDPQVRWTDKCPLPVLAVSLLSGFGAVGMLKVGFCGWVIPFFGVILSGIAGAGVALVSSLLLVYAAWGTYKLNIKAWWCAVLLTIAGAVSTAITFSRVNLMEFYERMNIPAQQLEIVKQLTLPQTSWMVLLCGLWVVIALAYLLYTRRYFVSPSAQQNISLEERL